MRDKDFLDLFHLPEIPHIPQYYDGLSGESRTDCGADCAGAGLLSSDKKIQDLKYSQMSFTAALEVQVNNIAV